MSNPHATLKLFRKIHLYFGVVIAPALLFFAFSGAMQVFSLHETTPGRAYTPPTWAMKMAQLHKKQTIELPPRKKGGDKPVADKPAKDGQPDVAGKAKTGETAQASKPGPDASAPRPPQKSHLPMKIFALLVAIGLFVEASTGIYMSYTYTRSKLLITALLVAGIAIPLLMIALD